MRSLFNSSRRFIHSTTNHNEDIEMDFEELHGIVTENNHRIETILKKVKVIKKK